MKTQYKDSQFTLKQEKVFELINSAKNLRDKIIIESAYFPALRRFEIAKLKVEDIDFDRNRLIIEGKGKKISPIPVGSLYPQYMADLKHYLDYLKKKSGYLFGDSNSLNESRINQIFNDTAENIGMTHPNPNPKKNCKKQYVKRKINPHLLRHSQARHLKNMKLPAEFIKNYMRHEKLQTTMDEYGTLGIEDMEKIALQVRGLIT